MAKKTYLGGNPLSTYDFDTQAGFKGFIVGEAITVDGNDFLLTLDSENELSSTIKITIDGNTLKLVGSNGKEQSVELPTIDVSTLFSLKYDKDTNELVLTFDGGEERVSLKDLVDVYEGGEGLNLDENVFSVDTEVIATVESVNTVKSELETSIGEKANKSEIEDMLTKTDAADTYQPKGDYLTEHQDLSEYAKTSDVETKLSEKQDKGDYVEWTPYSGQEGRKILKLAHRNTIAGETPKGGSQIAMVSDYDDLDFPVVELGGTKAAMVLNTNDKPVKIEITENGKRNQHVVATLDDLTGLAKSEDVTSQINSAVENKVDKSEFESLYGEVAELEADKIHDIENTNCLIIDKQDVGTDDKNRTVKIGLDEKVAKISTITLPNGRDGSEKEVVELGNASNQTVINSEDRLFVNTNDEFNEVAYLKDLEEKQDKGDYVAWSEYSGQDGRKILKLAHRDTIAGDSPKGGSQIAMVSDYDGLNFPVVEFGSTRAAMVLNSVEDRVKVEVNENGTRKQHSIATLDDLDAMKTYINTLLKNYTLKSDEEIKDDITKGGDFTLAKDLEITSKFALAKPTNLDLNDNEITNTTVGQDAFNFGSGNFTIKNGTVDNSAGGGSSAAFYLNSSKGTNLTLEDVNATGVYCVYLNNATMPPTCTINGGTFTSPNDKGVCVYIEKGGKAVINSGYFTTNGHDSTYLLNLKDSLNEGHDPREYIEVKGGTFVNFNPSASYSEPNGPVNFVADGYHVEEKFIDENTTEYTVVKDSE